LKFEIVFKTSKGRPERLDHINGLLEQLFGKNCRIDWRDDRTVEIRSDEVTTVANINYEKD
jgi:hypothetical protein